VARNYQQRERPPTKKIRILELSRTSCSTARSGIIVVEHVDVREYLHAEAHAQSCR
jgi:hypothetical protein